MKKTHWKILLAWCLCWGWGMLVQAELPDAETTLAKAQETTKNSNYIAKRKQQGAEITDYFKVMTDGAQLTRTEIIFSQGVMSVIITTENGIYNIIGNTAIKQPIRENKAPKNEELIQKQYSIEEVVLKNNKCYKITENLDKESIIYFVNQGNNLIQGTQWLNSRKQVRTALEYDTVEINNELSDELFQIPESLSVRNPATSAEAATLFAEALQNENANIAKPKGKELWKMTPSEAIRTGMSAVPQNNSNINDRNDITKNESRPIAKIWLILIGIGCFILIAIGAYAFISSLKNR